MLVLNGSLERELSVEVCFVKGNEEDPREMFWTWVRKGQTERMPSGMKGKPVAERQ